MFDLFEFYYPGYTSASESRTKTGAEIVMDFPGVGKDRISINYTNKLNILKDGVVIRTYNVGSDYDVDKITASYMEGRLTVKVPYVQGNKRNIEVT